MSYDRGYGPHDGWEYRMRGGTHGYDQGYRAGGEWDGERPWVGGYRQDYQGGSGGYSVNTGPRYLDDGPPHDRDHHEQGFRRPRGQAGRTGGMQGMNGMRGASGGGNGMRGGAVGYDRGFGASGGYDGGFRGAAGGYDAGMRGGYDWAFRPLPRGGSGWGRVSGGSEAGGYDTGFRGAAGGYDNGFGRPPRSQYDQPYRSEGLQGGGFGSPEPASARGRRPEGDLPFRNEGRPEDYHPRYSPVGGTYGPMGGSYLRGHVPRGGASDAWTSETTRWF